MTVQKECTERCTETPPCTVCGRDKELAGRSYPLEMSCGRCNNDCPGYWKDPLPGHVWWSEWRAHLDGDHSGCVDCGGEES